MIGNKVIAYVYMRSPVTPVSEYIRGRMYTHNCKVILSIADGIGDHQQFYGRELNDCYAIGKILLGFTGLRTGMLPRACSRKVCLWSV